VKLGSERAEHAQRHPERGQLERSS
jgi:hypothetical protein